MGTDSPGMRSPTSWRFIAVHISTVPSSLYMESSRHHISCIHSWPATLWTEFSHSTKKSRKFTLSHSALKSARQLGTSWLTGSFRAISTSMKKLWAWKNLWFIHTRQVFVHTSTKSMNGANATMPIDNRISEDPHISTSTIWRSARMCQMTETGTSAPTFWSANIPTPSSSNCSVR